LLRKEYGTFFVTASMALILIVREQVAWSGWHTNRVTLVVSSVLLCFLGIGWMVARHLKKTGALDRDRREPA
jgi:hypothetical protein